MGSHDQLSKHSELGTTLDYLLPQLLGYQPEPDLVRQLLQDRQVLNALFDLSEKIYENHKSLLIDLPRFEQSGLARILKQGRIVQPYFNAPATYPVQDCKAHTFAQACNDIENLANGQAVLVTQPESSLPIDQSVLPQPVPVAAQFTASPHALYPIVFKHHIQPPDPSPQANDEQHLTHLAVHPSEPTQTVKPSTDQSATHTTKTAQVIKMPHFQIPNARVGQAYQAQIQKQANTSEPVHLDVGSIQIPQGIGLAYDEVMHQFTGIPLLAGEFEIVFKYKPEDGAWRDGKCTLIITADPRSLWQVNEPAASQPYPKAHTAQQLINTAQFRLAAASRRGRSHEHAGSFRDDDYFIANIEHTAWSVMIVADGAGSASYSREGSRLAVQTTGQVLADYIANQHLQLDQQLSQWQIGSQDEQTKAASQLLSNCFHELFYKAAQQSIQQIEQLAQSQNVSSKFFATTLLAAVIKQEDHKTFVSTFWTGDGAIAVYSPAKLRLMGVPDGGEFAGQTRFLDKSMVATFNERVNIGYFEQVEAVILMTDGISDPKFETDAGLQNQQKWDALWQELQPGLQQQDPDQFLLDWMHFFSAGHHDDRTIALLWPVASHHMSDTTTLDIKQDGQA